MSAYRIYSSLPLLPEHKAEAQINLTALKSNFQKLSSHLKNSRAICVVKADAYGHGAIDCTRALHSVGCDFFAVSSVEEAIAIRENFPDDNNIDVIILGYTLPSQAKILSKFNIIQTVSSFDYATKLNNFATSDNCTVRVHIALDTGMNRIGLCTDSNKSISDTVDKICEIHTLSGLTVEGIFSHFSDADGETNVCERKTTHQYERFDKVCNLLTERGVNVGFRHICNSAGTVKFSEYHLDGVRLGIMLYGVLPSEYIEYDLDPVMTFKTRIAHVHSLSVGETVSYGGEYMAPTRREIATIPIGYADGFLRASSGALLTLHTSKGTFRVPVVGRVCMDQCMIDVTDTGACVGDEVVVFGDRPESLTNLAKKCGTIEYELLCAVSSRVPRIY